MHDVNRGAAGMRETTMSTGTTRFDDLFTGGTSLGPPQAGRRVGRPVLLFVGVTWVPLLVLAALENNLYPRGRGDLSFLADFGPFARYLIAGPLLLAANAISMRALNRIAHRFVALRPGSARGDASLKAVFASIRKLDTPLVSIACAVLAYAFSAVAYTTLPMSDLPRWHFGSAHALSLAGCWSALVSVPLLLYLLLRWLWRLMLWARFLRLIARLDLSLSPVHPDKAAGVAFLGYSLRTFSLLGAALGSMVAGPVANQVFHHGAQLQEFKFAVLGVVVFTIVICTAPLLAFTGRLLRVWQRGVHEYDELASELGRQFEAEWFAGDDPSRREMLDRGDFSAATDLYQVVERVHGLRLVPVDIPSIAILASATLLPFVPIVFLLFPFDKVIGIVFGLLR
jgi:hypothetical protein